MNDVVSMGIYYAKALDILRPNSVWIYREGTGLEWQDTEQTQPSDEELSAKVTEVQAAEPLELLREKRNALLAETDWWANSDLTMTAEQTAYRQALRDITDSYTSLEDVVWPTKP